MLACKILVVEDEPDIREIIQRFLQRRGYSVQCVASGAEGMHLLQLNHPHLLLIDKHLPDCLGDEMIHRVKALADSAGIKTVLMTADSGHSESTCGAPDVVLHKPFAMKELATLVEQLTAN